MSLQELESAVSNLPSAELTQFSEWFAEFMADQWDRQIEQDLALVTPLELLNEDIVDE